MYCSQFWRLKVHDLGAIRSCKDPLSRDWLISVSYMVEGAQKLCGISFIKALISLMRAPPSWPLTSQRHHFLIPSPLGVRISTYTFLGGHPDHNIKLLTLLAPSFIICNMTFNSQLVWGFNEEKKCRKST